MLGYKKLIYKGVEIYPDIIKTNKKIEYLNIPCGFDIETSSTYKQGEKVSFIYAWGFSIGVEAPVYYGRSWEQFLELCNYLQEVYSLNTERRLVIYVHNLGYEFQFMRKHFEWEDVFSISERKPIKALSTHGIEFRDSYILSGYSLEMTAKNLVTYKVKKLNGFLDYSLVRHERTILTKKEKEYLENDVVIITSYIQEQIEIYTDITKIPATNTGRVRSYVREACYYTSKNHRKSDKGKYLKYRKLMYDLTLNLGDYTQLKRAFMGGFTHANALHSGEVLEGVSSVDFTSSYPSVMVAEKFPMSRFKPVKAKTEKELINLCKEFCIVTDIKFYNLKPKITQETYLSESKCFNVSNIVTNNGRIVSADYLTTSIIDVDFEIMRQVYEWDRIELANTKKAFKNYLPKSIIESILNLYQKKTTLKDVEGYEVEYLLSKGMLNSVYGMSVTDMVKDNAIYSEEWGIEKVNPIDEIDSYNKSKTRFLYYPWGVWVTGYARRNLWTGILAVGDDYIYSDTDSLKLLNYDTHKGYMNWFNNTIVKKMEACLAEYGLSPELLSPKSKKGDVKLLGVWDYEGCYSRFKTLGAKRYIYEIGGKVTITVAGLSKQSGVNYMLEQAKGDISEVFRMFDDSLYIPASNTGKMTHSYIDEEKEFICYDYRGKKVKVLTLSGIHLEPCEFTLSLSEDYKKFLNNLKFGQILKGANNL